MLKPEKIEMIYKYIDYIATALNEHHQTGYLDGIDEALNYLLDDQLKQVNNKALIDSFKLEKNRLSHIAFEKETIRKGIQLALLKGFKLSRITNAQMTPDSIGIFISYLVKKIYQNQVLESVLDPLIGTANLVATLNNNSAKPFLICGIDDDEQMCRIARNMCDALEFNHQIFLQHTLTFNGPIFDLVITDFPPHKLNSNEPYLPYQVIMHHLSHLHPHHYFIAIIENNFFDQKDSTLFKTMLAKKAHMYGLIKLDENLFKTHHKSILILQKKENEIEKLEDFLLVNLPSFTDEEAFSEALEKINQWFLKIEERIQ